MTRPGLTFDTEYGRFYRHPSVAKPSGAMAELLELSRADRHRPNPSVTNVMKMLDEGFLPGYYSKLVAEHAVNESHQVDLVRKFMGDDEAISFLREVPYRDHPNAAIGDEVHREIELYLSAPGFAYKPRLTTPQAVKMFTQFAWFMQQEQVEHLRSEFTVWSYEHGYAGTGDLLWWLPQHGGRWLIDMKTGTRVYPKTGMQTAALSEADVILSEDGTELPMPSIPFQGVLHVRPMSVRLYEIHNTEQNFEAFLACLKLFNWTRFWKDSVLEQKPVIEHGYRKTTESF